LILGAQVLLGFQLNAAFQPAFDRIPDHARQLDFIGMALMMTAVALLIAPGPYHRIAEDGCDTPGIHRFATRMAEWAPVPFALAIGVDVFIVAEIQFGTTQAIPAGGAFTAFCAATWYGAGLARRQGGGMAKTYDEETRTSLGEKIKTALLEARITLPGAQALLGFQLAAFLSDGFGRLSESGKMAHFVALLAVALATVLLVAPAPYHRLAADGEDRPDVLRFANAMMLAALAPLAIGLAAELYVVAGKIGYAEQTTVIASASALVGFGGLWFLYPLLVRALRHQEAGPPLRGKSGNDARQQL
jgi:hypothetical protein